MPSPEPSPRNGLGLHPMPVHGERAETRLYLRVVPGLSPVQLPTSDRDSRGFCANPRGFVQASPCSIKYFGNVRACGQCLFLVLWEHVSPGGTGAPQVCPHRLPHQALLAACCAGTAQTQEISSTFVQMKAERQSSIILVTAPE